MTEADILTHLRAAVAAEFMVDPATLDAATTAAEVPGWDSISHAMLLMRLEDSLGRPLDISVLQGAANLAELARRIAASP